VVATPAPAQRQLVRDSRVVAFSFTGRDTLGELTRQLQHCGLAVQVETVPLLASRPLRGVYLVGFDAGSLSEAPAAVEWSRGCRPPAGLIAVLEDGGAAEREQAFVAGFDDAITQPVSARELCGRVRAVQRRMQWKASARRVGFGAVTLDLHERIAWLDVGKGHQLTAIETAVLHALIEARGRVLSYADVFRQAWNRKAESDPARDVQATIKRLRRKFGRPDVIETLRDVGLRLAAHGSGS